MISNMMMTSFSVVCDVTADYG